jgi:iturin family lipopeptide synthetase A
MTEPPDGADDLAIIGMACHVADADDTDTFWQNLCAGVESIRPLTEEELDRLRVPLDRRRDPRFVNAASLVHGTSMFDHAFWGYSPREATLLDPQQRLFLETAWEAMEHAGYDPHTTKASVGVYAGMGLSRYLLRNLTGNPAVADADSPLLLMGNDKDFLTTRVSYHLDLRGPSMAVQTGCSTSLVATHLAADALLSYQCDMALVGGVTLNPPHTSGYLRMQGSTASPDGHSRAFDADAGGTVFGDGVGVVVLKRLADALADRDTIHAVVKGSAVNNDGAGKPGFAAPGVAGQAEVVLNAQRVARVDARTIGYVEAHGTATALGDPVEVAALTRAFRTGTDAVGFCALGTVKGNVGHLDTAAGVIGLIKTALALRHRRIPPSLHFVRPNPEIDFARSPFYVNTELSEWPAGPTPRRAGVSAFGFGGTNAHVVLEEPPQRAPTATRDRPQVLVLSARTATALRHTTERLRERLVAAPELSLADVAYTQQVGRTRFKHRTSIVCSDRDDALAALSAEGAPRWRRRKDVRHARPVAFMLSGVGDQYAGMTQDLYEDQPYFASVVDRCARLLRPELGVDLCDLLYPARPSGDGSRRPRSLDMRGLLGGSAPDDGLRRNTVAYPAVFTVEYALAKQLTAWGLRPAALIGNSLGEYVAATLAGVFSLEDALRIVVLRARLIDELPGGAMLAVSLPAEALRRRVAGTGVSVALINSPRLTVVGGPGDEVDELLQRLKAEDVPCRLLRTGHAFHTAALEPVVAPLVDALRSVELSPPKIPMLSNVTGTWLTAADAVDPGYWGRQTVRTVDFASGLRELCADRDQVLVEIGPGQALSAMAAEYLTASGRDVDGMVLPSVRAWYDHRERDTTVLHDVLGQLWLAGADIDWRAVHAPAEPGRVPLPSYPFERTPAYIPPPSPTTVTAVGGGPQDRFFARSWRSRPLLAAVRPTVPERWLILADEAGMAAGLAQVLADEGREAVLVEAGDGFGRVGARRLRIDPERSADYTALAEHLSHARFAVTHVAHLWSLDAGAGGGVGATGVRGLPSLLHALAALSPRTADQPLRVWAVSSGTAFVESGDVPRPEAAALRGPAVFLPPEYGHVRMDLVDVPAPLDNTARLVEQLLSLVREPDPPYATERLVALRGDRRWLPEVAPVAFRSAEPPPHPLRDEGVYLITGALSPLGLDLADHLAATARARLALITATDFPGPEQWPRWQAEHGPDDPTSRNIRRLAALRERGAQVLVLHTDVANHAALGEALAVVARTLGPVNAVVHCAGGVGEPGTARGGPQPGAKPAGSVGTAEATEATTLSDARGGQALADLLGDGELDFCLLVSGPPAVETAARRTARHAGSAVHDALAARRRSVSGRRWISVDLLGGGAGAVPALREIMEWCEEPQVAVAADASGAGREDRRGQPSHTAPDIAARPPRPELEVAFAAPRGELETAVAEIWQDQLGIDGVGRDDDFYALGGHSLLATQMVAQVRALYGVDLPLLSLLGSPSVARFAWQIARAAEAGPGGGPPDAAAPEGSAEGGPHTTDRRRATLLRRVGAQRESGLRLICLPYAGGGTSVFRGWGDWLPDHVEAWAVQLPGREDRLSEPPLDRAESVIDALEEAVLPLLDRPFALFGHSMGAVVAWDLARRLGQQHRVQPRHLFVSGCWPPNVRRPDRPWHELPDAQLIEQLRRVRATPEEILTDPELVRLFLPTIRADLAVAEADRDTTGTLDCPVTAFGGQGDVNVPQETLLHWGRLTTGPFDAEEFPGGHLFLTDVGKAVVGQISVRLSPQPHERKSV